MSEQLSAPLDSFKPRELEILHMMATGMSNAEIADALFITKETVRWYNKQIYSKLGTSRRTEAIALARDLNLISDTEPAPPKNAIVRQKLPVTTGPFIGRDADMAELADLLQKPETRLLSIIGAGGMGKSRISLELGHLIQANYEHGAAFIDLTAVRNPDDIASVALSSLGLSAGGSQPSEEVLFNYCREKHLLLIFDNFEHVLTGSRLVTGLLEIAPNMTLIATSRERLNLRAETAYYLQPIGHDAEALFLEVAAMMHPQIETYEEDRPDIQRIIDLVGGLPLGLILAATWIDTLSIAEIADEIASGLDFLSAEMGDMPDRQRSIHALVEPTWRRLTEQERKAFMWASVFRGGFTRELFQQVTGASMRVLQTLLNRSLIMRGNGRRYDMHPLIRQYAREQLEKHHMLDDAKKSHLATFTSYAQHHAGRMYGGYYLESLEALEHEADNVRAALDWSLQGNHAEQGVSLVIANCEFWQVRSRVLEAITYVEKAIALSNHPLLLYWQATYLDRLGQVDASIQAAQRLIASGETNQNHEILAYGQFRLGMMQNATEARPLFEAALVNALKTNNQRLIALCHNCLSLIDMEQFPLDDSRSHLQQALKIFEATGDLHGISRVTNNIAIEHYDNNRIQEAQDLLEYSLQLKRQIGDRAGEARRLTTLSMWAMDEEELEQAREWLMESHKICEELGELERLSYVLSTQGLLYILMVDFEQARTTLEYNLQIDLDIQVYRGAADIYSLLCYLHILQDNPAEARLALQNGIDVIQHDPSQPAMLIVVYVNYLRYTGKLDACIPLVAALSGREISTYVGSNKIIKNILLQPLIYRIRQHIGEQAWQEALKQAEGITIEQIYDEIARDFLP